MDVNRDGFLVHWKSEDGIRTYACADRDALNHLIERLTGEPVTEMETDERDLPHHPHLTIGDPLHIYSTDKNQS